MGESVPEPLFASACKLRRGGGEGGASEEASWEMEEEEDRERKEEERGHFRTNPRRKGRLRNWKKEGGRIEMEASSSGILFFIPDPNPAAHLASD